MKNDWIAGIMLVITLAPAWAEAGPPVFQTAAATGDDPVETGRKAATELKAAFGETALKTVLVMDTFEDLENKQAMLAGLASVLPKDILFGGSSYGGFTQKGSVDYDSVLLLGIGGGGVTVTPALAKNMGAAGLTMENDLDQLTGALGKAGEGLARQLPDLDGASLLLLISDAHSPKNQLLLDGVQKVTGKKLPITGGSVNKNAGQNWVYFRGEAHTDSALALSLTGPFAAVQTGRAAMTNEAVIETARESSAAVLQSTPARPLVLLAFNCGGRMGKLNRLEDELESIQASAGADLPIFGVYCAGEYGPADPGEGGRDATPCGRGWHVMFTALTPAE